MNSKQMSTFIPVLAVFLIAICGFVLLKAGTTKKSEVTILKLGHGLDITHPVHLGMVHLAEKVAEKSNGTLKVEIYPNEQLGNEKECIEALQLGYLAMTKTSSGPMESFVPTIKVFGIPYLHTV